MIAPVQKSRLVAALMGASACAVLAACSPAEPTQAPPPPPQAPEAPPPPLAGGAPPPVSYSPYGPPPRQLPPAQIVTMNPIANPEDLPPEARAQIYGQRRYDRRYAEPTYVEPGYRPHHHEYIVRRVHGHRVVEAVHPRCVRHAAPDHVIAPPPHSHPAPAPVRHAPPPVTAAPHTAPVAAAPPMPAPTGADAKLKSLQEKVGQTATYGAMLTLSPSVLQGQPGQVTLTLPANLDDVLQVQRGKMGLRRAAREAEISATLTGEGFTVLPAEAQTEPLKPGHVSQFSWDVTPGPDAKGTLHAQIDGSLKGQGAPKALSFGVVQSPAVPAATVSQPATTELHLPSFSHFWAKLQGKDQPEPANGQDSGLHLSGRAQLAIVLALIAVVILVLIRRNMVEQQRLEAKRKRERAAREAARVDNGPPDFRP